MFWLLHLAPPLRPIALLLATALLVAVAAPGHARRGAGDPLRIAMVIDGASERMVPLRTRVEQEIRDLLENDAKVVFDVRPGDWTGAGAATVVDAVMTDRDVDLVITMGLLTSTQLGRRARHEKPAIATVVIDPSLQGVPFKGGASGKKNLTYLSWSWSPLQDLTTFRDLIAFQRPAMLVSAEIARAAPELADKIAQEVAPIAPNLAFVGVGADIDAALAALPEGTDAVVLGPLFHLDPDAFSALVAGINTRKLPSFSFIGRAEVDRGVLAATARGIDQQRFARKIALFVQRILIFREPAARLPVAYSRGQRLSINMATAHAIGFSPSWRHLTEADLVKPAARRDAAEALDLAMAISLAVAHNQDLHVSRLGLEIGAQDIRKARAPLLPQLSLSLAGQLVDDDRAAASFGSAPERLLSLQGEVSQVIYSEEAWANLSIQGSLQSAREREHDALALDIVRDAAVAYLNVVRAKTVEAINKDNLRRTRENLELAQTRHRVGVGTMADVHRFESEIATGRSEVIDANAQRNLAEIALNRLLHRRAEQPFSTSDSDVGGLVVDPRVAKAFESPKAFRVFREFMAERAVDAAPELARLDHAIAAQERLITARERKYWVPDVGASFSLTQLLAKGGAGAEAGLPIPNVSLPSQDDTLWTASLFLRLPLFEGGARYAEAEKARLELAQLAASREATAERVEQRVRSAIHSLGARSAAIGLSRDAAVAAHKNLDIVTESYSRGAVSIPTLLDAQSAAFLADSVAANAQNDYLIAAVDVFRAAGAFPFRLSEDRREAFVGELQRRLQAAGLGAPAP